MKQGKGKRVQVITNRTKQDKNRTKWANNEGKYVVHGIIIKTKLRRETR